MKTAKLIPVVSALTLVVALSGCGRFGAHPVAPAAPPTTTVSSTPGTDTGSAGSSDLLGDVESDLGDADGATSQSDSDMSDGDQAAQQNDSQ